MNDITLLRTFLAIYRAGSVSGAADALHISQPAVTAHLKSLELLLDTPLFVRSRAGARPTHSAHELARVSENHLDALENVVSIAQSDRDALGSIISIGGPGELMGEWLLPEVRTRCTPQISLHAYFSDNDTIVEMLTAGELDFAVATAEYTARGLDVEMVGRERLLLVCAPRVAATIGKVRSSPEGAAALAQLPLLSFDEQRPLITEYWREVFHEQAPTDLSVTANSLRSLLVLCEAGCGIAVLPDHMCTSALRDGRIVTVHKPQRVPENTIYLLWRSGSLRTTALRTVHEAISAVANP